MLSGEVLIGRTLVRGGRLPLILAVATLASASLPTFAQDSKPGPTGVSVEEAFSSYHEALNATATGLLADAQRASGTTISQRRDISRQTSPLATASSGLENEPLGNHKNPALTRLRVLQPVLEQILREEAVPPELAGVVLVESGGVPSALSPKGARGIWQFMPDTARRYGLTVTSGIDERLDIYRSTRAAARYLRDLYSQFGSWPLALAAYNAGEELVARAVARSSSRDFNVIARAGMLPLETRGYVLAVTKAIVLMRKLNGNRLTAAEWGPQSPRPFTH